MTTPATFAAHPITAADGRRTVVDEYTPDFPLETDSAVLFLPALGVPIGYYRPLFEQWAARGRRVFGLEIRGQERSSASDVRRNDFGYATILEQDLPAALEQTPLGSIPRLIVVGHSLGGQLALAAAGSGILHPDRIVMIASGSTTYRAASTPLRRVARRMVTPTFLAITAVVGHFPGDRIGFGGRQPKTMMADWHREGWYGAYRFAGTDVDYEEALGHVDVPILAVTFARDPFVPHASADLLLARVSPARPDRVRLTVADNGGIPLDHVRWVRQNPALVLDVVEGWLRARPPS